MVMANLALTLTRILGVMGSSCISTDTLSTVQHPCRTRHSRRFLIDVNTGNRTNDINRMVENAFNTLQSQLDILISLYRLRVSLPTDMIPENFNNVVPVIPVTESLCSAEGLFEVGQAIQLYFIELLPMLTREEQIQLDLVERMTFSGEIREIQRVFLTLLCQIERLVIQRGQRGFQQTEPRGLSNVTCSLLHDGYLQYNIHAIVALENIKRYFLMLRDVY